MNTLYILLALTLSNGNMYEHEVTGSLWKGKVDCLIEYKRLSKHQTNNTKFVCMPVNNDWDVQPTTISLFIEALLYLYKHNNITSIQQQTTTTTQQEQSFLYLYSSKLKQHNEKL